MKRLRYLIATLTLCCSTLTHAALLNIIPDSVDAAAWTVIDSHTQQVIAAHNDEVQRAPASLTKMMVAYIALQEIQAGKLDKNELITASPVVQTVMWDESQMYLKEGEQISVDQLLAGLIVMSANDAAVTLAERISGSVPKFIQRMNQEAHALGMLQTNFQNPAGVTMPEHFSTAADLAKLGLALVNQTPAYLDYSKQTSFVYNQRFHRATNVLLKIDPSVDGLKTGFTRAAGYNLALTANRMTTNTELPERRLVVVVLGAKNAFKRAEISHQLMNIGYVYTRNELAIKNKQLLAELPVQNSTTKTYAIETQQPTQITTSLYPSESPIHFSQFNSNNQRLEVTLGDGRKQIIEPLTNTQTRLDVELKQQELIAPIDDLMQLATVKVYQNEKLITTVNVENQVSLVEATWFEKLMIWLKNLLPFFSSTPAEVKIHPLG